MSIPGTPEYIYRDYEVDGDPTSGDHKPVKQEIIDYLNDLEGEAASSTFPVDDAVNNGVSTAATIKHSTSGTPAAGIGVRLLAQAETAPDVTTDIGDIAFLTTNVGTGTETSDFAVRLKAAGAALATKLRLKATGELLLSTVSALATAVAGALEFDGRAFYATSIAGSRQVLTAEQISILAADFAGSNVNTAQPVFSAAQDTLQVAASTSYEFEAEYEIDNTGTTSNSLSILFGGTATFTAMAYSALATNGTASGTPSAPAMSRGVSAAAQAVTAAVAAVTQRTVRLRGTMRVNGGGTLIPQFQYSAAPGAAPTIKAGSFFRCWPIGSDAVAAVGGWA